MRFPKPKTRKKTVITPEKVADMAFGLYVKSIAGWRCDFCGLYAPGALLRDGTLNPNLEEIERSVLDVSHFVGRRYNAGRFNFWNVDVLCRNDHTRLEKAKNPVQEYWEWKAVKLRYGNIAIHNLRACEYQILSLDDLMADCKQTIVQLREKDYVEIARSYLNMLQMAGFKVQWFRDKYSELLGGSY